MMCNNKPQHRPPRLFKQGSAVQYIRALCASCQHVSWCTCQRPPRCTQHIKQEWFADEPALSWQHRKCTCQAHTICTCNCCLYTGECTNTRRCYSCRNCITFRMLGMCLCTMAVFHACITWRQQYGCMYIMFHASMH